jgi:chorismate mutase
MKKIAQTKKQNKTNDIETQIREGVLEMWSNFNKSDADRQIVLDLFSEAEAKFANKPRIIEFFENLKSGFLKSEVENEKNS